MSLNQSFISDFSEYYRWSQRTKIKYKLHYGWCTGRRFTAATRHKTSCQAFEKFNYSVLRNSNIIHERCRPIQKWDLGVFIFIEHIRKLTIEFLCLFETRLSNTLSILPFQRWNTFGVFFLTIDVPIEVSGVCLNITNQVIHIQIVLSSYISLNFSS